LNPLPYVDAEAPCRGYLLTQVLGGVWADKFGGKKVLGFGVIWWSIATALTPMAAKLGLFPLLLVRACMGIGEGVAMPAMNNMLSRLPPPTAAAPFGALLRPFNM
jgi:ACS family sodium-dependent inorganic phosphate cotransporter